MSITCGAPSDDTLWQDTLPVPAGGFIAAGFADGVPDYADIKAGTAGSDILQTTAPIVVWGYVFGGRTGDEMQFMITGPAGDVIDQTVVLERNQAQLFRVSGRRAPAGGWDVGNYAGTITLIREGVTLDRIETTVSVR